MKHLPRAIRIASGGLLLATALLAGQYLSTGRLGAQATGAVPIVTLGTPLTQSFDSLIASGSTTWVNDGTLPGWYHARVGTGTTIVANNGGNNAGNLYSYGTGTATDRALGSVGSGNAAVGHLHWGVRLSNQTASTVTSLTVSYIGEQWRNSAAVAQTVDFSYRVGPGLGGALTDFTTGGVATPQLSFTSPITGGTAGAIDGNDTPNRVPITHTITGLSLAPGDEILLRWSDIDHSGADHGLSIDDLSITANGTDVPAVSINNVSLAEGNSGSSLATFTVSVSSPTHSGVSFDIATADGTATAVDGDYVPRAETGQVIPAGSTSYSFAVQVNGDTTVEPDEIFAVTLSNVTGATLLDAQGDGTIVNDDAPTPVVADVVISQVYGGGGNAGSTLTHDFIELFNSGATAVSLSGWSIQYTSSAGSATWQTTPLTGTIPAGGFYLIQQGAGGGGTVALPTPNATGTIAMSATAGKVALRSTTTALTGSCPTGLVDLVGYGSANCFEGGGPAPAPSATTAALRKRGGCFDSDNNNIDFAAGAPAPRNTSSPLQSCTPTPAAINAIQGPGLATPFAGQYVTTTGIVTALKGNGFFLQTPDADVDSDPLTSEALFVFTSVAPAVAVGNAVSVGGTATEFFNLTQIEATLPGDVTAAAASNPVPAAIQLTSAILDPAGSPHQLERFEGMRMYAPSLTSVAPTNEFGEIAAVLTGVARPMREPGISVLAPVPPDPSSGSPDCCIPRFDENPERIFIDSDGLAGAAPIAVTSHVTFADVIGPLDFTFGLYKLLPEAPPATSASISGLPVPVPAADELTVAGFNIENFAGNDTRRRKAALAIRQLMQSPDVIGHIEILDLATLQSLADQVNADAISAGEPNPAYQALLIPAPAGGTQNVGFLVKTARVRIDGVTQELAGDTFTNPNTGQQETLHDRPPLVLRATFDPFGANPRPFIVVVNHLRSFIDVELVGGDGPRVRAKRTAQAESVAGLLQTLQTGNPDTAVISVGDYNAYEFSDGYTDPIAILKGAPTPDEQLVVDGSPDVVEPNFVNLTDSLPRDQRYSFIFEGTPQALDHVLVNTVANGYVRRYAIARGNADFPESDSALVNDVTRPERSSDHDMPVAYFRFPPPSADVTVSVAAGTPTTSVGGEVTFTITATNNGPFAAQNVAVTNHLSPTATVVSCSATGGGTCTTTGTPTATFPMLAPGASETITLVGALSCSVPNNAVIVNMATITSSTSDPVPGNNAAAGSTVATNAAPSITGVAASRTRILLPLHEMVPVTVSYTASDTCGPVTTALSVTSNEPVTGPLLVQGLAGLTSPDWQVVDATRVRLRAERSISGDGRIYTITITATDAAGGKTTRSVTVTVPRYILPWMREDN